DDRRPPGRAARQPHLPAAGRRRPDSRGALDLCRARLSRRRPRALVSQGYGTGDLRPDHRQGSARRLPAADQDRGNHPRPGKRPRSRPGDEAGADDGPERGHRALPLRARRQGRRERRQTPWDELLMTSRISARFAACARENRPALVTFTMAGDPDLETSQAILDALPAAGADVIELGMPFSDPMADGPGIQMAGQRALKAGQTLRKTLAMVREF